MNNSDNWMRYFEHMILNELQSLNSFNFTVNRESIDTNEFNVRFEIETRTLPLFNFSGSHGHGKWSLQFGSIYHMERLNKIQLSTSFLPIPNATSV